MKTSARVLVLLAAILLLRSVAADAQTPLNGTWSGDWTPKSGVGEGVTIELAREQPGKLTGRFLSPQPMNFTAASYDPKTQTLILEAIDQKSGTRYKLVGKLHGNDITGTMDIGDLEGRFLLIKWTYFGGDSR